MTAQITDHVIYQNTPYQLIGVKGSWLPNPGDYGLTPTMISTACYRGYYCDYTVRESRLLLTHLVIRVLEDDPPPIEGVAPIIGVRRKLGDKEFPPPPMRGMYESFATDGHYINYDGAIYADLKVKTHFTGGLLIAGDFINSMYVHMGFQKPTSFKTVLELVFEDGELTSARDHSETMAERRAEMLKPHPRIGFDDEQKQQNHLKDWIEWTFSLDYDV